MNMKRNYYYPDTEGHNFVTISEWDFNTVQSHGGIAEQIAQDWSKMYTCAQNEKIRDRKVDK